MSPIMGDFNSCNQRVHTTTLLLLCQDDLSFIALHTEPGQEVFV